MWLRYRRLRHAALSVAAYRSRKNQYYHNQERAAAQRLYQQRQYFPARGFFRMTGEKARVTPLAHMVPETPAHSRNSSTLRERSH